MCKTTKFNSYWVSFCTLAVPFLVLASFPAAAEERGRLSPFSPPQHISIERRYRLAKGSSEIGTIQLANQILDSPESVATLRERLASVLNGKYRLYEFPPFYVTRDDGIPIPEGAPYLESLDVPITVQLKEATVWEAMKAWNASLNEALASDELLNRTGWFFETPFGPTLCFEESCVNLDYTEVSARDVLLEIMRQAPVAMSYTYMGANEGEYVGRFSELHLFFYSNSGQRVSFQDPDGRYWISANGVYLMPEEREQAPTGTHEEERAWLDTRNFELNPHFWAKVKQNRPPTPNTAEVERDRMAALFAADAEQRDGLSPSEQEKRDTLVQEGKEVFEEFFATIMALGDYEQLNGRLLFYGVPSEGMYLPQHWPRLKNSLTELRKPLASAYEKGAFDIDTASYDFAAIGDSDYLIRLPLKDSEGLATAFLAHIDDNEWEDYLSNSITVEEGVGLFILMRKIEDVWYWNPFGW